MRWSAMRNVTKMQPLVVSASAPFRIARPATCALDDGFAADSTGGWPAGRSPRASDGAGAPALSGAADLGASPQPGKARIESRNRDVERCFVCIVALEEGATSYAGRGPDQPALRPRPVDA